MGRCLFCGKNKLRMYRLPDSESRHLFCDGCGAAGPWADTAEEARTLYEAVRPTGINGGSVEAGEAAREIANNLSAIKGEDGSHLVENVTAIIRSYYRATNSPVSCRWIWTPEEHGGFWTVQCKEDEDFPVSLLHDGATFCSFCGGRLIVES